MISISSFCASRGAIAWLIWVSDWVCAVSAWVCWASAWVLATSAPYF